MLVVAEALKSTSSEAAINGRPGEPNADENLDETITIGDVPDLPEPPLQPSSSESSSLIVAAALNIVGSHAMFGRNWWVVMISRPIIHEKWVSLTVPQ